MTDNQEIEIQIDGLALKQDRSEKDDWLPNVDGAKHYPPYKHQVMMRDIIENEDEFVAMNTTVTGGGKTFSYAVPVMRNDLTSIVVFPTNALTADQYRSISELASEYFSDKDVYIRKLTADHMQERREDKRKNTDVSASTMKNSQQIQRSLDNANKNSGPSFILTNPDVFLGILRGRYGSQSRQKVELADILIVDEFHHAKAKGQNSLIFSMDEMYHRMDDRCNLKKFVFLSATPDEKVESQLSEHFGGRGDDIYYRVDSRKHSKPVSEISLDRENYNPVMPQVSTTFIGSRPFSTKKKITSDEYFDRVIDFVESGRTIVILDGVAEVNDVYNLLDQNTSSSYRVEPISGLRPENTEDKLNNADIIVANSTLEVGVDIGDVENLVFSGYSASRFMQRLGRLRAQSDMLRKSAVCFTTPDTLQTFGSFQEMERNQISRDMLQSTVDQQLGADADPDLYKSLFSPVEMYRAIDRRAETMFDSEPMYREKASQIVAKHCFKATGESPRKQDIERMWEMAQSPLGEALQSYRQSSLSVLVYDTRTGTVKTYSIPNIVRLADVEFLTEPEFDKRLIDQDINPDLYKSEKRYVQSFAWMKGHKSGDKLRNPHVVPSDQIRNMVSRNPKDREPQIMSSIEFTVDKTEQIEGLATLNRQIDLKLRDPDRSNIVGYATEGHPAEIQTVYGLDEFFFTNPISDMNGEYTLALGSNAMYLYCHVQENLRAAEQLHKNYEN